MSPEPNPPLPSNDVAAGSLSPGGVRKLLNVFLPITMQDVRLHAGEGKLEGRHVLEAVNIELRIRRDRAQAFLPLPEDER